MAGRTPDNKAFTMLELLVAMVLMVVTASCLYTALYTGFKAQRSAKLAVGPTAIAINAIELIKEDIAGVLLPGGVMAGAFVGTDATGAKGVDADSLSFYTTHVYGTAGQPVGGMGQIELVLEEDTDNDLATYRLIRRVTTNLLSPREVDPDEQILCRNVASLNLQYFDGDGWLDEWDSTADANSLPLAVEVDIQIAHKADARTKELLKRRLVQSFAVPCGNAGQTESESDTATAAAGGSPATP